ncbi:hydrogenase maturation protease [Methylomonas sp. MS20]|uniref:hydrogenase maturation protease n=1 Tax=unclassified Methylomonas TaxID=2608980 RepID=UPI0028A46D80|nr:hydrogenase maturation protease [Methylomonas sp. MV1]MDT4331711.1 hydrogenase maturation protease [Methylomonas sp. MV1]
MTALKPVLVFAYGNPSRGDDALGPLLLEALENQVGTNTVEFIVDFQLQIEHALDLQGRRVAIFVDASVKVLAPYQFGRLAPLRDRSYTSHAMSPAALLDVYQALYGEPPPAFLLGIAGLSFELGEALSPGAAQNLALAVEFACRLLSGSAEDILAAAIKVVPPLDLAVPA